MAGGDDEHHQREPSKGDHCEDDHSYVSARSSIFIRRRCVYARRGGRRSPVDRAAVPPWLYSGGMGSLAGASLSAEERVLLGRFVQQLHLRLGDDLHAVWLFGSRARGERTGGESDVDVLVLVEDASWSARMGLRELLDAQARELGLEALAWSFSIHVNTPAWLAQRREIESFFIAEVDRDKVVLSGSG